MLIRSATSTRTSSVPTGATDFVDLLNNRAWIGGVEYDTLTGLYDLPTKTCSGVLLTRLLAFDYCFVGRGITGPTMAGSWFDILEGVGAPSNNGIEIGTSVDGVGSAFASDFTGDYPVIGLVPGPPNSLFVISAQFPDHPGLLTMRGSNNGGVPASSNTTMTFADANLSLIALGVDLGGDPASPDGGNGVVHSIALYPPNQTDADLQRLSTP